MSKGNGKSFVHFLERIANFILQVFERVVKFILTSFNIILIIFASILGFILFMILFGIIGSAWNVGSLNFICINGNLLGLNVAKQYSEKGIDLTLIRIGTLLVLLFPLFGLISISQSFRQNSN